MMTEEEILAKVPGAEELVRLFGYWPLFHDAESVSVELNRSASSVLAIHTFQMTSELTDSGHYKYVNHVVMRFFWTTCRQWSFTISMTRT